MPGFESVVHVEAPPSAVWPVVTDLDAFEQWNPMTVSMRGRAELGARLWLRFVMRPGGRRLGSYARVLVCDAERELRWGGGLPGLLWVEHWLRLAPDGAGTRVEHAESFRGLLAGPLLRLLRASEAPYHAVTAALKERVEAGAR